MKNIQRDWKQDMMKSFIKNGLSESQIADNMLVALLAGSETTATVLKAIIIHIISNPNVYQRLQSACDISDVPPHTIISYSRAQQIPYLDTFVKEILRYYLTASRALLRKMQIKKQPIALIMDRAPFCKGYNDPR